MKTTKSIGARLLFVVGCTAITFVPAFAAPPKCKGNPQVIGACYSVHGRLNPRSADTIRLRLWPVGTKRMLGIAGGPVIDDAVAPIYPNNIKFDSSTEAIYGDFEVCPFTPEREGAMQLVCIESASNLVVKRFSNAEPKKP
jgi:hypothetical protein